MHQAEPECELLQCYDEQGNPNGSKTREDMKATTDCWGGISNIWLVNDKAQLLCSKRSEGLSGNPGKWQTYFGGHVPAGLSFREAALKELSEEIGIKFEDADLFLVYQGKDDVNKKFFESYAVRFNGSSNNLIFTDGEITEARWMTIEEYMEEENAHPEFWCNRCKPERQEAIRRWVDSFGV